MKSKEKTLIRDLARLFTNYSVRDWKPIVRLLNAGESKIDEITTAIEQSEKPKARTRKRRFKKKPSTARRRKSAKTEKGIAKPKAIKQAPKAQTKDKNRKSSTVIKRSSRGIKEDPTENYRLWTRLISGSERKR